MSTSLTIDGKEYIPATIAGKEFEYTKDYLLLLIKQGKIDGKKIANRWYVHMPSAKQFFADAKKSHNERREKIRVERKLELEKYTRVAVKSHKHSAITETVAIVLIGLTLGATGYLGLETDTENVGAVGKADSSFFESLARALDNFFSPDTTKTNVVVEKLPIASGNLALVNATSTEADLSPKGLIVAPVSELSTSSVDAIRDSFSDEVEVMVDPENSDTGVIVPKFKSRDGEAYRFLMVPVTPEIEQRE